MYDSFWLAAGWHLHCLFGFALFLGVVLFVVWAVRLKSKQLIKWVVWLLVVGAVGMLLTAGLGWKGFMGMKGHWKNFDKTEMIEEMQEHMSLE